MQSLGRNSTCPWCLVSICMSAALPARPAGVHFPRCHCSSGQRPGRCHPESEDSSMETSHAIITRCWECHNMSRARLLVLPAPLPPLFPPVLWLQDIYFSATGCISVKCLRKALLFVHFISRWGTSTLPLVAATFVSLCSLLLTLGARASFCFLKGLLATQPTETPPSPPLSAFLVVPWILMRPERCLFSNKLPGKSWNAQLALMRKVWQKVWRVGGTRPGRTGWRERGGGGGGACDACILCAKLSAPNQIKSLLPEVVHSRNRDNFSESLKNGKFGRVQSFRKVLVSLHAFSGGERFNWVTAASSGPQVFFPVQHFFWVQDFVPKWWNSSSSRYLTQPFRTQFYFVAIGVKWILTIPHQTRNIIPAETQISSWRHLLWSWSVWWSWPRPPSQC